MEGQSEINTYQKEIEIQNELGLHARPAAMFVKLANSFSSEIRVEKNGEQVNGKSIMGIMMLAASKGSRIRLVVNGDDAEEAVQALEDLLNGKFGEK